MSHYSRLIAESLAERRGLSAHSVDQIARFSRLHDIGKIGIPDRILLKQGPLTDEERQVMNTHVQLGLEMIGKVLGQYDHERLDGSAYPEGLKGEAISLEGRIVAVADVFDAVVSRRTHHDGCTIQLGLAVVQQQAATGLLDSECVSELVQVLV